MAGGLGDNGNASAGIAALLQNKTKINAILFIYYSLECITQSQAATNDGHCYHKFFVFHFCSLHLVVVRCSTS
jgi:hypothetical protein